MQHTSSFGARRGFLPNRVLLSVLGMLMVLPVLVPVVASRDDGLFLYPYIAILEFLCVPYCLLLAQRRQGIQRLQWRLAAGYFGCFTAVYFIALAGDMGISPALSIWLEGFAAAVGKMAILVAITSSKGSGLGSRRIRTLDACMALLLPALQFIGSYSATYAGYIPDHLYVSFAATVFLALVATAAYAADGSRSPAAFSYVIMVFLWYRVIDDLLINLVNYQWLQSPMQMPFDLIFGTSPLLFCWLANRALQHADESALGSRRPSVQSLMPSLLALAGVVLAPLALHEHPVVSAAFIIAMVSLYVTRTHLLYQRLMQMQTELRSHAGRLEHLATRDALTGIGNRRALQDAAAELLRRVPTLPAALILMDVDHFKHINDAFGHSVGDDVLQRVADILCGEAEKISNSCCARLGGDEFVILLPDTDLATTEEIAEYVRERVQEQYVHEAVRATISMGITVSGADWTLSTLLKDADEALYRAKSQGRNLVVEAVGEGMTMRNAHVQRLTTR